MKRLFAILILAVMIFAGGPLQAGDGGSPIQLYLGLRGGAGLMLANSQLGNLTTSGGIQNINTNSYGPSGHAKGEILLGFKRLRFGYRFLYNFSAPHLAQANYFDNDASRQTTYYNGNKNNFFGHYLLVELAVINLPHFALTPGVAVGSFSGFKVDNTSHASVWYSADMHHPFSIGAELNAEFKAGRCTFLIGPNYYLFTLQDRSRSDWHLYQHYIGADIGLRVNLLK